DGHVFRAVGDILRLPSQIGKAGTRKIGLVAEYAVQLQRVADAFVNGEAQVVRFQHKVVFAGQHRLGAELFAGLAGGQGGVFQHVVAVAVADEAGAGRAGQLVGRQRREVLVAQAHRGAQRVAGLKLAARPVYGRDRKRGPDAVHILVDVRAVGTGKVLLLIDLEERRVYEAGPVFQRLGIGGHARCARRRSWPRRFWQYSGPRRRVAFSARHRGPAPVGGRHRRGCRPGWGSWTWTGLLASGARGRLLLHKAVDVGLLGTYYLDEVEAGAEAAHALAKLLVELLDRAAAAQHEAAVDGVYLQAQVRAGFGHLKAHRVGHGVGVEAQGGAVAGSCGRGDIGKRIAREHRVVVRGSVGVVRNSVGDVGANGGRAIDVVRSQVLVGNYVVNHRFVAHRRLQAGVGQCQRNRRVVGHVGHEVVVRRHGRRYARGDGAVQHVVVVAHNHGVGRGV
nr:hypothetical protein [Tanacetum cinerariifolium]